MNKTSQPFLTLLFNVFLTKKARYQGVEFQNEVDKYLSPIRASVTNYRERSKIEICGYALASIAEIKWDHAIINIEISNDYTDEEKTWLMDYAKNLLPSAHISSSRAKSRDEYLNIFREIKSVNPESYVLFIPNHDHIYMGADANLLHQYVNALREEEINSPMPIRLCYSNQLENILAARENSPIFGLYLLGGKIVKENKDYLLVERRQYAWDSYYLSNVSIIQSYFEKSKNEGYCPRGEDCYPYPFPKISNLSLIPKVKLFEHFDGSHHVFGFKAFSSYRNKFSDRIPPLFIPNGFFDNKIKLKVGDSLYDARYVNIGYHGDYIYLNEEPEGLDMKAQYVNIPFFWKKRVDEVRIVATDTERLLNLYPKIVEAENPYYDFQKSLIIKRNRLFKKFSLDEEIQSFYERAVFPDPNLLEKLFSFLRILFKKI
jgi:hypothetical protein